MDASLVWFVSGLVLLLLELAVPGIILVFLGISAWIVAGLDVLGVTSTSTQLWVFAILSVVQILVLRRFVKSWFFGRTTNDSDDLMDEFIGKRVLVTQSIDPDEYGQVELKGASWKASAEQPISEGQYAKVTAIDGLCLIVVSASDK